MGFGVGSSDDELGLAVDDRAVALGGYPYVTLRLLDAEHAGAEVAKREIGASAVSGKLAVSPRGDWIVTNVGRELAVFDVPGLMERWKVPWGMVTSLRVSPRGSFVGVGMVYGPVHLLDPKSGADLRGLGSVQNERAPCFGWSEDEGTLVTAGEEPWVRLFDTRTGALRREIEFAPQHVHAVALAPDGAVVAAASHVLRRFTAATGEELPLVGGGGPIGHVGEVLALAAAPNGEALASGGADGDVWLWDARTRDGKRLMRKTRTLVESLAFSADGKLLAVGGKTHLHLAEPTPERVYQIFPIERGEGFVTLFEAETGHELFHVEAPPTDGTNYDPEEETDIGTSVTSLAFAAGAVVAAYRSGPISAYDRSGQILWTRPTEPRKEVGVLHTHALVGNVKLRTPSVSFRVLAPDASRLAVSTADVKLPPDGNPDVKRRLEMQDPKTGRALWTVDVQAIHGAFDASGATFAVSTFEDYVLFDAATGRELGRTKRTGRESPRALSVAGGRFAVAHHGFTAGSFKRGTLRTTEPGPLARTGAELHAILLLPDGRLFEPDATGLLYEWHVDASENAPLQGQ